MSIIILLNEYTLYDKNILVIINYLKNVRVYFEYVVITIFFIKIKLLQYNILINLLS